MPTHSYVRTGRPRSPAPAPRSGSQSHWKTLPGYAHIALPLGAYCDARSLAQFATRLMFSALVGNGDLHAKNWSLPYPARASGRGTLSNS